MLPIAIVWRLFATTIVMSDTGSIAIADDHMDYPSERSCRAAIEQYYQLQQEQQRIGDRIITIRLAARCDKIIP